MARNSLIKIRRGTGVPSPSDFEVGEPAFNGAELYVKNSEGAMVKIGTGMSHLHCERGRFYIEETGVWVCPIGPDSYSGSGGFGTGSSPTYSITMDSSFFVPAGTFIKNLQFGGKSSTPDLQDLQLHVVKTHATDACWKSGIDGTTCSTTNTVIYDDSWVTPTVGGSFTGSLDNFHYRKIAINNTVSVDSIISIYMKPTITVAYNDPFDCVWTFELLSP